MEDDLSYAFSEDTGYKRSHDDKIRPKKQTLKPARGAGRERRARQKEYKLVVSTLLLIPHKAGCELRP